MPIRAYQKPSQKHYLRDPSKTPSKTLPETPLETLVGPPFKTRSENIPEIL